MCHLPRYHTATDVNEKKRKTENSPKLNPESSGMSKRQTPGKRRDSGHCPTMNHAPPSRGALGPYQSVYLSVCLPARARVCVCAWLTVPFQSHGFASHHARWWPSKGWGGCRGCIPPSLVLHHPQTPCKGCIFVAVAGSRAGGGWLRCRMFMFAIMHRSSVDVPPPSPLSVLALTYVCACVCARRRRFDSIGIVLRQVRHRTTVNASNPLSIN